jgi:hypothetical protein
LGRAREAEGEKGDEKSSRSETETPAQDSEGSDVRYLVTAGSGTEGVESARGGAVDRGGEHCFHGSELRITKAAESIASGCWRLLSFLVGS